MTGIVNSRPPVVSIIDDDEDVREALKGLFRSVRLQVATYDSVNAFLAGHSDEQPGCVVLDIRLPGKSGLDFQEELACRPVPQQIVFISGHADVAMSVRAMKAGAVEFLTKPVRDQDLLDAVHEAVERDRLYREGSRQARQVQSDFDSLTVREREVLKGLVDGQRNKEIAGALGVSEATVKLHRAHLMQKLRAQTLVDLVRIADLFAKELAT